MAALAETGELIVAEEAGAVVGGVAYVGPGIPKKLFPTDWPVIRMLVVAPESRGQGIGRALTERCIRRAERDGALLIALHTSPIMTVAVPMYERLGFRRQHDAPPLMGVPYGIYVRPFAGEPGSG